MRRSEKKPEYDGTKESHRKLLKWQVGNEFRAITRRVIEEFAAYIACRLAKEVGDK